MTAAGLLEVAWLERVSHYAASHPARLDWEAAGRRGVAGGVAGGLRLANLQLGAQYTVTLTDLETNTTTAFNFTACKLLHFVSNCCLRSRPVSPNVVPGWVATLKIEK